MKRNCVVLTIALVVLALTASQVMAQPPAGGAPGQGGPGQGGFGGRGGGMGMRGFGGQDMYDEVGLTDAQKKQMEELRAEFTKKLESATPETRRDIFTEMRDKMQSVLTEDQKKKMEELRTQRGSAFGGFGGPGQQGQAGVARGPMFPYQRFLAQLKLTEEQRTKITQLEREAVEKLFNDIRAKVLTAEQRVELEKLRAQQPAAPGAEAPKPAADKVAPAKEAPKDAPVAAPADKPARGQRRAR